MPDDISPEDREMLAKTKFKEWFNECFTETFGEAFDKRVTDSYSAKGQQPPAQGQPPQQPPAPKGRRRSLLEQCFSQTFGMS